MSESEEQQKPWYKRKENETTIMVIVAVVVVSIYLFISFHGDSTTSSQATSSSNQSGFLKKNALICVSSSALDNQVDLLVEGITNLASGCFIIPTPQRASLIDGSLSGTCVVRRHSDNKQLWTLCEDYD